MPTPAQTQRGETSVIGAGEGMPSGSRPTLLLYYFTVCVTPSFSSTSAGGPSNAGSATFPS